MDECPSADIQLEYEDGEIMPELVSIPIAIVEIVIEYANPSMKLLVDRAKVVDQLFRVFKQ